MCSASTARASFPEDAMSTPDLLAAVYAQDRSPGPSATERAILHHAIELFGRRGYDGTGLRAIASAAEVTPPLITYHFGSKSALFRRCVEIVLRGLTERAKRAIGDEGSLEETVRRYAAVHIAFAEQFPAGLRFLLAVAYGPEEGLPPVDLVGPWAEVWNLLRRAFERAVSDGRFEPRGGVPLDVLVLHLANLVHLELFGHYERERFGAQMQEHALDLAQPADPVADIVAQFFHGAGRLREAGPDAGGAPSSPVSPRSPEVQP